MKSMRSKWAIVFPLIWAVFPLGNEAAYGASDQTRLKPMYEVGKIFLKPDGTARTIALFVESGATFHDVLGAYTTLNAISKDDLKIHFVGKTKGLKTDEFGRASLLVDTSIEELPNPDILIIGANINPKLLSDPEVNAWLKRAYENSEYTLSVCAGALNLAASGAILGKRVTTAFTLKDQVNKMGSVYVPEPLVVDGKLISAAGLSSGIEIAYELIERITGDAKLAAAVNLLTEFNPNLKYGPGSEKNASEESKSIVDEILSQMNYPRK